MEQPSPIPLKKESNLSSNKKRELEESEVIRLELGLTASRKLLLHLMILLPLILYRIQVKRETQSLILPFDKSCVKVENGILIYPPRG